MNAIEEAAKTYGERRILLSAISDAERSNIRYKFDEYNVVSVDDGDAEDYPYDDRDVNIAIAWKDEALAILISEVEAAGLKIEMPYNDSVYIHNGNGRAITIRDHEIASSTWRHWDELFAYKFGETIDISVL